MSSTQIPVVYIAGSGRSGSTLLERVLGQLPIFQSVGELRHIWYRNLVRGDLCGCGKPVAQCEFWTTVFETAFGALNRINFEDMQRLRDEVDRTRHLPRVFFPALADTGFRSRLAEYSQMMKQLYEAIHRVSGEKIILDSSKDLSTLFILNRLPEFSFNVIHLVRDSRGVAYSWSSRQKFKPEITSSKQYLPAESPLKIAIEWDVRNLLLELNKNRFHRYQLLRYEDFTADPLEAVSKLVQPLGEVNLDLSYISGKEVALTADSHTIAGNPIRFQSGTITLRKDVEWQSKIKTTERLLVTILTLPYLVKYMYL